MARSTLHPLLPLPIILLLLLTSLPSTSALDMTPPAPLPESDWINKTNLNYTTLHEKYAPSLYCTYTPTGVFGYYHRIGVCLSMILSVSLGMSADGMTGFFSTFNFISSLPPLGFSYYLLVQNARSLSECPAYQTNSGAGNTHIRGLGYTGMVSACLFALGSTLLTFMVFPVKSTVTFRAKFSVMAVLIFASIIQFWLAKIYFIVVAASWDLGFTIEYVRMDAAWCIYAPLAVGLGLGLVNYLWVVVNGCRKGAQVDPCGVVWQLVLYAGVVGLSVCNAIATVRLGNVVGDPYGKYALEEATGIADAVLLGVVPVFQLGMLVLSKYLGKYEEGTREYYDKGGKVTVTYGA
ncbi:hypothetical protein BJ508DRAFT_410896 [Ascobolus immersus RN42]|uniref:Uncharacterized protein n=1 Tax=Ascobolus immersus RN42 TaxID=1160509 RepID=A0A3N4IR24_ASCIM|nr:hypothetical protein BJ508DRAFT_410896 [Ascobolus immersus RN42]